MRSLVVLTVLVAIGVWTVIRQLPDEARAQRGPVLGVQEVQSVAIDGRGLPLADLRALLETRPGTTLDDTILARDRAAIEADLGARGFLAATVEPAVVTFGSRGGAYVVFDVDAGPMFHLRSIEVTGPGKRDAAVVTLAPGDEASRERLERAHQVLADTLGRRGDPAPVGLVVHEDRAMATVDIELVTR